MVHQKVFVAVAGNIGSGKTTLTRMLSEKLDWVPFYEKVEGNPYLPDFYLDMTRWSFHLQIFFLSNRLQVHQQILQTPISVVQDRIIYEDAEIFAKNLNESGFLNERDYQSYLEVYKLMTHYVRPPDLVIYLKKSLPVLKDRIRLRGREFEKQISDEYLQKLNQHYDNWINSYNLGKKLIIESDDLDFQNRSKDFEWLTQQLENSITSGNLKENH